MAATGDAGASQLLQARGVGRGSGDGQLVAVTRRSGLVRSLDSETQATFRLLVGAKVTTKTEAASRVRTVLQSIKDHLAQPSAPKVNEATTRAHFLNPLLDALGYRSIDDILFEWYLPDGKTFLDYRLVVGGKPRVAVEAKALDVPVTDAHAAQAISYAAILGDEWAVVTNAREWRLYHAFAQTPLADKLILKVNLLGWESDSQFDAVFEQLWLISKDAFETGDGPGSWLASRKLDQLLRSILTDPASPEVKYLRGKLEQRGVTVSPERIAAWLKGRIDNDPSAPQQKTLMSKQPVDSTTVVHEPPVDYAASDPIDTPGARYWLIPSGKQHGYSAADHLKAWLSKGFWGFGPSTPGRKAMKPGDWACFYAAKSQEVLAYAQIAGSLDEPVQPDEWPGPDQPQGVVYKVPISGLVWLTKPIRIDAAMRAGMDAFKGKVPGAGWSWLVQTTHRVTESDFRRLTGT